MRCYDKRHVVEAEQFFPDNKPWPQGVECSMDLFNPEYWLVYNDRYIGRQKIPLWKGSWIVRSYSGGYTTVLFDENFKADYDELK